MIYQKRLNLKRVNHNGETYTIQYGEFQDEKQDKEFADIMNQYISNILPFFEYAE